MPAEVMPPLSPEQLFRAYLDETDPEAKEMLLKQHFYELDNSRQGAASIGTDLNGSR